MEKLYARDVYGKTLVELGEKDSNMVVLDADLSGSTRTSMFAKRFPDRFFNLGVAEQNMMGVGAGFSSCGKTVFVSTFAMFATARCWDQVRNTVCYNNFNVKIVATHGGITVGPDGASHQALEDVSLMRSIPNMRVIVPCDALQTREAVLTAHSVPGPFYIRLGRPKVPTIECRKPFVLGKGNILKEGKDITIIACGFMVHQALLASQELQKQGIEARIIDMPTIKPMDEALIEDSASRTRCIITCEEHSIIGGLGAAVSGCVASKNLGVPVKVISTGSGFGQSGNLEELLKEYGLEPSDIVFSAKEMLKLQRTD